MGSGASKKSNSAQGKKRRKNYLLDVLDEHEQAVNCMALSEDGSILVTGSDDCTARLWSTRGSARTDCVGILQGHESYIICMVVEDNYLLTGSADKTIKKWDLITCQCLLTYTGHSSLVNRIICTGDFLFSSSYDRTARCYDFESGICLRVFRGHERAIYPLIFIPADERDDSLDGSHDILISGSADFTARAWSFETAKCLTVFKGHTGAVMCMSTDPAGKHLFTGSSDHSIKSWDIIRGDCVRTFQGHTSGIICMLVVNKLMYTGSSDHTSRCWVTEFGDCTRIYKGHTHSVTCLKYRNGLLFTGCGDGVVRIFDTKTGSLKRTLKPEPPPGKKSKDHRLPCVECLEVVDDKVFTGAYDGSMRVWNAEGLTDEITFNRNKEKEKSKNNNRNKVADSGQGEDGYSDKERMQMKEADKFANGDVKRMNKRNDEININGQNTQIIMDQDDDIDI